MGDQPVEVLVQLKETLRTEQAAQEEEPAIVGLLRPRGHSLGGEQLTGDALKVRDTQQAAVGQREGRLARGAPYQVEVALADAGRTGQDLPDGRLWRRRGGRRLRQVACHLVGDIDITPAIEAQPGGCREGGRLAVGPDQPVQEQMRENLGEGTWVRGHLGTREARPDRSRLARVLALDDARFDQQAAEAGRAHLAAGKLELFEGAPRPLIQPFVRAANPLRLADQLHPEPGLALLVLGRVELTRLDQDRAEIIRVEEIDGVVQAGAGHGFTCGV